jgi:hypothetical protein
MPDIKDKMTINAWIGADFEEDPKVCNKYRYFMRLHARSAKRSGFGSGP